MKIFRLVLAIALTSVVFFRAFAQGENQDNNVTDGGKVGYSVVGI